MRRRAWNWLLVVPFAATLIVPIYAHRNPQIAGLPFFYWYQLLWVVLAGVVVGIVYFAAREASSE